MTGRSTSAGGEEEGTLTRNDDSNGGERSNNVNGIISTTPATTTTSTCSTNHNNNNNSERRDRSVVIGSRYERFCQPIMMVVSAGLNLPAFVLGMININPWCDYYSLWLVINSITCLINVAAVVYSIVKLRQKMLEDCVSEIARIERHVERMSRHQQQQQHPQPTLQSAESNSQQQQQQATMNDDDNNNGEKITAQKAVVDDNDNDNNDAADEENPKTTNGQSQQSSIPVPGRDSTVSLSSTPDHTNNSNNNNDPGRRRQSTFQVRVLSRRTKSSNRLRHLICYNAVISTYAIIFVFWAFWLASGAQLESNESKESNIDKLLTCEPYHKDVVTTSLVLGYTYMAALLASILLSYCDRSK